MVCRWIGNVTRLTKIYSMRYLESLVPQCLTLAFGTINPLDSMVLLTQERRLLLLMCLASPVNQVLICTFHTWAIPPMELVSSLAFGFGSGTTNTKVKDRKESFDYQFFTSGGIDCIINENQQDTGKLDAYAD